MRLSHSLLVASVFLVGCEGCKKNSDDDVPPPLPSAPPMVSVAPKELEPPKAVANGPADVVRPELDNRDDGITGQAVTVSGAKAKLQAPSDWKLTKGDAQVATSGDSKSRFAVASFGTEGPAEAIAKLSTALGLTECQWGGSQSLTVGKDKLATDAADGTCKRGGNPSSAAHMATEGLVVVGAWDEGADRSGLFGSMRSVTKLAGGSGTTNLIACCRMLANNAKAAPPTQAPFMLQAAATCEAAARNNNAGAVNAALSQFGMKCK